MFAFPLDSFDFCFLLSQFQLLQNRWRSKFDLKEGIRRTYPWVKAQVAAAGLTQQ